MVGGDRQCGREDGQVRPFDDARQAHKGGRCPSVCLCTKSKRLFSASRTTVPLQTAIGMNLTLRP